MKKVEESLPRACRKHQRLSAEEGAVVLLRKWQAKLKLKTWKGLAQWMKEKGIPVPEQQLPDKRPTKKERAAWPKHIKKNDTKTRNWLCCKETCSL